MAKISTTNAKVCATIAGIHAHENNKENRARKIQDGVCWEDTDFRTISLDSNVLTLDEAPDDEVAKKKTCVFCTLIDGWEDNAIGPKVCPIVEQNILSKYCGLKWIDPGHGIMLRGHPDMLFFQRKRGGNSCKIFGCMDGYFEGVKDEDHEDMWEKWFCNCATNEIAKYYQLHPEEGVIVYVEGENPESRDEGSGDKDEDEGICMTC